MNIRSTAVAIAASLGIVALASPASAQRTTSHQAPQTPPPASAPPTAPPAGQQADDLKAALQRIQQRIDEELAKSPAPKPATRNRDAAAPPRAQGNHIKLTWRVVLTWPAELTPPTPPPTPLRLIWR